MLHHRFVAGSCLALALWGLPFPALAALPAFVSDPLVGGVVYEGEGITQLLFDPRLGVAHSDKPYAFLLREDGSIHRIRARQFNGRTYRLDDGAPASHIATDGRFLYRLTSGQLSRMATPGVWQPLLRPGDPPFRFTGLWGGSGAGVFPGARDLSESDWFPRLYLQRQDGMLGLLTPRGFGRIGTFPPIRSIRVHPGGAAVVLEDGRMAFLEAVRPYEDRVIVQEERASGRAVSDAWGSPSECLVLDDGALHRAWRTGPSSLTTLPLRFSSGVIVLAADPQGWVHYVTADGEVRSRRIVDDADFSAEEDGDGCPWARGTVAHPALGAGGRVGPGRSDLVLLVATEDGKVVSLTPREQD